MASQGNKRTGEKSSTSDHHLSKRHCGTTNYTDAITDAKECIKKIFHYIETMPLRTENNFIEEIKEKKINLEKIKKDKFFVGVLGVTGAGKSSLVNAVLGQKRLLPSGTIGACTSVIIELTANMENSNYEAEIEFIPEVEWDEELKALCEIITNPDDADRQMVAMAKSKIQALYGDGATDKDFNTLTAMENFSDIFANGTKIISHENVEEFSKAINLYTCSQWKCAKNRPKDEKHYWPLVRFVTIKVPNAEDLLENIVLVDVPGTGDWNKARDKMWEQYISKLSSVWVVADINRAASDNAAWSILDKISDNLGPGGQCNSATFICTKTDNISSKYKEDEELPIDGQFVGAKEGDVRKRACILDRNKEGKEAVELCVCEQYKNLGSIRVFTVSSEEFQKTNETLILKPDETEIPKLRALMKELNDQQSKTNAKPFVLEVFDIISMIHSMNSKETEKNHKQKSEIKLHFMSCLEQQLKGLRDFLKEIKEEFDRNLTEAATKSKEECVAQAWNKVIDTKGRNGYHNTLKALCRNNGFCRSRNGVTTNLNATLIKTMKDAINRRFSQIFLWEEMVGDGRSIYSQIYQFNILSENLREQLSLEHLVSITIKQENVRDNLKKYILNKKKDIYHTLSVQTFMKPAYEKAARVKGTGSTKVLQDILKRHIENEKNTMFSSAKDSMLDDLESLMKHILTNLHDELLTALMKPFNAQKNLLPDVSEYYERMRRHHHQLTENIYIHNT